MSIFDKLTNGISCCSAEETMFLGEQVARALPDNQVLALDGNLGAGKTTFAKGIGKALGLNANAITSPTFNIYAIHKGSRQLVHMDGYRLEQGNAADELLIEEFLTSPWLVVVEWPDRGLADWMLPLTWTLRFKRQRTDNSLMVTLVDQP